MTPENGFRGYCERFFEELEKSFPEERLYPSLIDNSGTQLIDKTFVVSKKRDGLLGKFLSDPVVIEVSFNAVVGSNYDITRDVKVHDKGYYKIIEELVTILNQELKTPFAVKNGNRTRREAL